MWSILYKFRGRYHSLSELAQEFMTRAKRVKGKGRLVYSRVLYLKSLKDYMRLLNSLEPEEFQ